MCKMCDDRDKNWSGSDPTCGWSGPGGSVAFNEKNWNCATLNALRQICEPDQQIIGIDSHYCGDDRYAVIDLSELEIDGLALWVSWYKNRGRTDDVLILGAGVPRHPTEAEVVAVIELYALGAGKCCGDCACIETDACCVSPTDPACEEFEARKD